MAAGVPAVTSNLSSMPEVAGDAALLVDPRSAAGIAAALDKLLTSATLREALRIRGKERAKRFTWKNSAEQSAEFFTRVGN
jgi:glycosyltransferase involved in cell wall biosynthesis